MIIFDGVPIDNKYTIGDAVYLIHDPDQHMRIITAVKINPGYHVIYELSIAGQVTAHYEIELTSEKTVE